MSIRFNTETVSPRTMHAVVADLNKALAYVKAEGAIGLDGVTNGYSLKVIQEQDKFCAFAYNADGIIVHVKED